MSTLNCKIQIPDVPGLEADQMTVGRHMLLACSGDSVENFDVSKAQLSSNTGLSTSRLFKVEKNGNALQLDMTLYRAGHFNFGELTLTDGTNTYQLSANDLKVVSVLKPPAQGEKEQQPFGPIFPVALPIPALYLELLGLAFVLLIVALVLKIRQTARLRRLKAALKKYDSPTEPDTQFYRSVRNAEKNNYDMAELEKAFMLYNVRSYKVPLFDLSPKKALKYFKNEHPHLKKTRSDLDKFLREFDELSKSSKELSAEAKHDMVKKMYRYVETHRGLE